MIDINVRHPKKRVLPMSYNAEKERRRNQNPDRRFYRLRAEAKKRGIPFSLNKLLFLTLIQEPCSYCGEIEDSSTGGHLDRVDNNKSYNDGNVVPCCKTCNSIKGQNTVRTFLEKVSTINTYCKKLLKRVG